MFIRNALTRRELRGPGDGNGRDPESRSRVCPVRHTYKEHPTLTCHLRDGQLTPVPESLEANVTVWLGLPVESGDEQVWEGLLAYQEQGGARAQIRAVPLFAYDINFGDEVSVTASAEGALVATGIVTGSGNYTFRIWREDADEGALRRVVTEFGNMGCYIEGYTERLVGLSCRGEMAQTVADALMAGEQQGRFVYETGRRRTH